MKKLLYLTIVLSGTLNADAQIKDGLYISGGKTTPGKYHLNISKDTVIFSGWEISMPAGDTVYFSAHTIADSSGKLASFTNFNYAGKKFAPGNISNFQPEKNVSILPLFLYSSPCIGA